MNNYKIAPSILSADFSRLGEDVSNVIKAGADLIHFDVMDNHYVPNLTFGPIICSSLKSYGITVPVDVHLMIKPVDRIIPDFAEAGADYITFHPEASEHIDRTINLIKQSGCEPGSVLNPATSVHCLENCIDDVDMILLMSVNPGFAGQRFIEGTYKKIEQVRKLIDLAGKEIRLEVDGGITIDNIAKIATAGADTFVAGSSIFKSNDYAATIKAMKDQLAEIKK